MVILKGYQSSVTGLLILFQLLPLLPGTPLSAEYSTVWSSLDSQSSREETLTTLSVSPSGNSTYILNPFHPDYKSNTHCCTTFGNYRNIGIRKYKPQLKQNRSQQRVEVWGRPPPATRAGDGSAWLAIPLESKWPPTNVLDLERNPPTLAAPSNGWSWVPVVPASALTQHRAWDWSGAPPALPRSRTQP